MGTWKEISLDQRASLLIENCQLLVENSHITVTPASSSSRFPSYKTYGKAEVVFLRLPVGNREGFPTTYAQRMYLILPSVSIATPIFVRKRGIFYIFGPSPHCY